MDHHVVTVLVGIHVTIMCRQIGEPYSSCTTDNKWPDGVTELPWKRVGGAQWRIPIFFKRGTGEAD